MVMPFDTYGASRRAREMQDEVERRRRLQRDLGNPQADNANIYSTSFDPPPGAMNPFSNPNLSAPSAPPPATSPSDVVNRQMLFTPSQTFVSAEEEERNRQRLAQEEAVRLDATLRAQQQAAAATQSGG